MNIKNILSIFLFSMTSLIVAKEIKNIDTEKTNTVITDKIHKKNDNSEELNKKNIYLNFENSEISNFINYIAEIKKINLIPDKSLKGVHISLTIREPLNINGAWNVFLTVLDMAGYSIIKIGDVQVVMPKANKVKQPLPSYINVPITTLPDSDENIRYVTFLENIDVTQIQPLLDSMLSAEHNIMTYKEVNGLIITDKSYNIKSAMKVVRALDQTGIQESVIVLKLKRVNAIDVKTLFDSLIEKGDNSSPLARLLGRQAEKTLHYFSPTTRIISEERSNSLILLGNNKSIEKIKDFIINHVDTELKGINSPLHIYELQHTNAEQIKDILETVTDTSVIGENFAKYGAVRDGVKYFKAMKFQVDKDGNRLIVSSSDKQDWKLLKQTIRDLDKPQPQVALETMFVSIDVTNSKSLGGSLRNKKSGQIGKHINFQSPTQVGAIVKGTDSADSQNLLGDMLNAVTGGLGSSIISFGKSSNIWGVFKALNKNNNVSIISEPFMTVANKTKGTITFGETKQVKEEETNNGDFAGYAEKKANTVINITPQINLDGIINLDIDIDIEGFIEGTDANTNKKALQTKVTVSDGQVIALGGFVKTKVAESINKTPILGDIPILGWLFKQKSKILTKKYIFMFVSPTIIKPRTTPGVNLYTRMKLSRAITDIDSSSKVKESRDPIENWFFSESSKKYSTKVSDFASAKYQPTTVDIKNDTYYTSYSGDGDFSEKSIDSDDETELKSKVIKKRIKLKNEKTKYKIQSLNSLKRRRGLTC